MPTQESNPSTQDQIDGARTPSGATTDRTEIRQLIDDWALWRDTGEWDRLASLWHADGRMNTTWCQVDATEFIQRSKAAWKSGMKALHILGGCSVDVAGNRAIAQTRMQIIQRAQLHDVLVDVHCHGRFWDALQKEDGRWLLRLRQPVYELDYILPVDSSASIALEPELLNSFPEGYRHLAYLQTHLGFVIKRDLPGTRGPEIEALYERGRCWLAGDAARCLELPN